MRDIRRGFRPSKSAVAREVIRHQLRITDCGAYEDVELCSTRDQPIDDNLVTIPSRLEYHPTTWSCSLRNQEIDDLRVPAVLPGRVVVLRGHRQQLIGFQ